MAINQIDGLVRLMRASDASLGKIKQTAAGMKAKSITAQEGFTQSVADAQRAVIAVEAARVGADANGLPVGSGLDDAIEAAKTVHTSYNNVLTGGGQVDGKALMANVDSASGATRTNATALQALNEVAEIVADEDGYWNTISDAVKQSSLITDIGAEASMVDEVITSARGGAGDFELKILPGIATEIVGEAAAGKYDPVVGRSEEIQEVFDVLARRKKANPLITGSAGDGKTTIVEGLAQRIASGNVPEAMQDAQIWSLQVSDLLAGAAERGALEEKVKGIITELTEAKAAGENVYLFIDEVHTIMNSKEAEAVAQILKPALANGTVRMIGATTTNEARVLMKDPALERRFGEVAINGLNKADSASAMRTLRESYESYHRLPITESSIIRAVNVAEEYFRGRPVLDTAMTLVDEAAASLRNAWSDRPVELVKAEEELDILRSQQPLLERDMAMADVRAAAQHASNAARMEELGGEIEAIKTQAGKERALLVERSQLVNKVINAEGKDREKMTAQIAGIDEQLAALKKEYGSRLLSDTIDVAAINKVASDRSGVPVEQLEGDAISRVLGLGDRLKSRVIGQDEAVEMVAKAVRRRAAGMADPNSPSVFLFKGPTGVGKTHVARSLTKEIPGGSGDMVRFDMGEFKQGHTSARLFGSPPGYVGHGSGGELTNAIKKDPYAVILLDEVEKAHPEIFQQLLALLEEGRLTDGQGNTVDASKATIIMTTNLGQKAQTPELAEAELDAFFSPEFQNRIDGIATFDPLSRDSLDKILDINLEPVMERAENGGLKLVIDEAARDKIVEEGYNPEFGARPLNRAIDRMLLDPVGDTRLELIQSGDIPGQPNGRTFGTVHVTHNEGDSKLSLTFEPGIQA